jgi:hypothetical protein
MRFRPLQLAFALAALAPAAELPALQSGVAPRDTADQRALAGAILMHAQMAAQYALMPDDLPHGWGPDRLLREPQLLGLSAEQRRGLEAFETRMEEAFFRAMGPLSSPDSTLLGRLWVDAIIDPAELARQGLALDERGKRALLEFSLIRDEILTLLTPVQRAEFLRLENEEAAAWLSIEVRSAAEAAEILDRLADSGMLPHALLVARLMAAELGLSPAEMGRLDELHEELLTALEALRDVMVIDTRAMTLSPADLQAALDTAGPWNHHVAAFATELLHLRDATYRTLDGERAASLRLMQADVAARPFRRHELRPRECRAGGMGGGGVLGHLGHDMRFGYGLTFRGDVAEIHILVIGRGDGGRLRSADRHAAHEGLRGSGFSMGRWMIAHDPEAARLWLQETPIELGDANVVILDLDGVLDGDVPRVAAVLRIDPLVPTGGCAERNISVILQEFVLEHPELQPYLRR